MLSIILFIFIISAFAIFASFRLGRTFEELLPISSMGIILILFIFGMFNGLAVGATLVAAGAACLYAYTVYWVVKNGGIATLKKSIFNLITPGSVVFVILSAIIAYCNKGRLATKTDEFSHWLDTVVIMSSIDRFGTAPNSTAVFPSYPPAMSLFQYLLEKINMVTTGDISEWKTYFAYQLLAVIVMLPFLKVKGDSLLKKLSKVITWLIVLVAPLYFFPDVYSSLYIDPFLGIMAGSGFAYVALKKERDWVYNTYMIMLTAVLTLSKDVGILLALFVALYYLIDRVSVDRKLEAKNVILTVAPMLSLFAAKLLWKLELTISQTPQKFSDPFDVAGVIDTLKGNGNEFYTTVYDNFRAAITYRYIYYERMGFNYVAIMVLLTAVFILFQVMLYKRGTVTKASAYAGAVIPSFTVIFYVLSMFPLYVSRFSEYEATNLASFDRYCGIVFLTGTVYLCFLLQDAISEIPNKVWLIIISVLLVLSVRHSKLDIIKAYMEKVQVAESMQYREAIDILASKINSNTSKDASILLVGEDGQAIFDPILETISKPRSITYSDIYFSSDPEKANEGLSVDELKNELMEKYDYVAIYSVSDNLKNNYSEIFGENDILPLYVYSVDKTTGELSLNEN